VPELTAILFDGGYEIKNYLCASELCYVVMREMQPYGRCYEEALAMDFMEARRVTEPSAPEVEPAREDDLDEIFDCAQRFVADCGLLDKPEKESFRKVLDSIRVIRADGKIVSMARIAPATGDDLRLVLVYTRDEYRGRGYARKVVNSAKKRDFGVREARDAERRPEESGFVSCVFCRLGLSGCSLRENSGGWSRITANIPEPNAVGRNEALRDGKPQIRAASCRGRCPHRPVGKLRIRRRFP